MNEWYHRRRKYRLTENMVEYATCHWEFIQGQGDFSLEGVQKVLELTHELHYKGLFDLGR